MKYATKSITCKTKVKMNVKHEPKQAQENEMEINP